jgi:2-aminoadipate transaminase
MNWTSQFAGRTLLTRRSAVRELLKIATRPEVISFAGGLPAPEFFPVDEILAATESILTRRACQALQYGETEGLRELREFTAESTGEAGLRAENVLIVSGSQQALDLIGRIFLESGDRIVVENPTYLAALSAWRPYQPEFLAISGPRYGTANEELFSRLRHSPKFLYTIPNFQNPRGATLDSRTRLAMLEQTRHFPTLIVEDDPYGQLRFEGTSVPGFRKLATGSEDRDRVILLGSFSKVLAPGLRVGWVVAAEPVIEQMVRAKQAMDLHTSAFNQTLALELARAPFFEAHLKKIRAIYRERRDAMMKALEDFLPGQIRFNRPEGGMFLMVEFPAETDCAVLLNQAISNGVAFVPGEEFHLNGERKNTARLNFSNAAPDRIREGVRRLAESFRQSSGC